MNWEQKLDALKAINDNVCLKMRKPGDWYVASIGEIAGDGMLRSCTGNGRTPEAAVVDQWEQVVVELSPELYIKTKEGKFRWNGYRWVSV